MIKYLKYIPFIVLGTISASNFEFNAEKQQKTMNCSSKINWEKSEKFIKDYTNDIESSSKFKIISKGRFVKIFITDEYIDFFKSKYGDIKSKLRKHIPEYSSDLFAKKIVEFTILLLFENHTDSHIQLVEFSEENVKIVLAEITMLYIYCIYIGWSVIVAIWVVILYFLARYFLGSEEEEADK